jgi:hypothetical protein
MSFARLKYLLALLLFLMLMACDPLDELFKTCPPEYIDVHGNCTQPNSTIGAIPTLCPLGKHPDGKSNCVPN